MPAAGHAVPDVPDDFVVENAVPGATFTNPTCVAFLPDGRMLVGEKGGSVWVVQNGVKLATRFWDGRAQVLDNVDRAFMDIAVDPSFATNRYVYFLYTVDPDSNGTETNEDAFGRLVRFQTSLANPNVVDLSTRAVLFGRTWPEGPCVGSITHTVGSLNWGTDGSLIVSIGEGAQPSSVDAGGRDMNLFLAGRTNSAEDIGAFRSQYIGSLAGKILRLNPATGQGYASNPFYDGDLSSVQSRVWAYGVRNPFRVCVRPGTGSTDPADGDPGTIYVGDVGWEDWEEVSVATQGGRNFGWPCYEGTHASGPYMSATPSHHGCGTIGTAANPSPHTPPITDWHHTNASLSSPSGITGNAAAGAWFYTGTSYPALYQGALFHADYAQNWIRVIKLDSNDNPIQYIMFGTLMDAPVDLTPEPTTGDLYYVSITTGQVRRIRYVGPANAPPTAVAGANPTSGPEPLLVTFSSAGSSDPDLDSLGYAWDFGDGNGSTAANPTHTFVNSGIYNVTLTVNDGHGGVDSDQILITVGGVSSFPSTPVLDNFNRANGAVGPNWADPNYGIGTVSINNNAMAQVCCTPYSAPTWVASSFGPNQEAYFTFSAIDLNAPEHSLNLKAQGPSYGTSHIEVRFDGWLDQITVGTFHLGGPGWVGHGTPIPVSFAAGDQFGARALVDGSVEIFKNGVSIGVRSVSTWAYAASGGYIGLSLDDTYASRLDNFGGGNYVPMINTPPTAVIDAPAEGDFFSGVAMVDLQGNATDGQQSASAMAYHWDVALHHNNHTHPGAFISELRDDSFLPEDHEDGTGTYYEVRLWVTDGGGMSDTATVNIYPEVDLEPSPVTVSPDPARRIDVNLFSFKLYNHGRILSRRTRWQLLAGSNLLAEADTMVAGLDSLTYSIPVDVWLEPGSYDLRVVADTLAEAQETDESNNGRTRLLEVQAGPVGVESPGGPLWLSAAVPNPTSHRSTLRLQLPQAARVGFAVHDIQGREVWSSPTREMGAGRWSLEWDAGRAPAGVYLARVVVGEKVWVRRIAVVR